MLAAWAARIVAISGSRVRDSLIFGSSCFLGPLFFICAPTCVLARISRCALRTLRSRRSRYGSSCRGGLAPGHK
jgi:hypothetical protein